MRVRKALAAGLVVGILAVVIGAAAPATAAPSFPTGWNPKQFMINVLGSLLSAAGGDNPYKRAVIAADQKFDHSWEALDAAWKKPASGGAPATYEDYVLQRQEYFDKNNLTSTPGEISHPNNQKKWVRPARVPATGATKMLKFVGGIGAGVAVFAGWEYRAQISDGIVKITGYDDTTGAVCRNSDMLAANGQGFVAGTQNWLTGVDCDAWKTAQDYVANTDVLVRPDGWSASSITYATGGQAIQQWGFGAVGATTFPLTILKSSQNWNASQYITYQCWNGTSYHGGGSALGTYMTGTAPPEIVHNIQFQCSQSGSSIGTIKVRFAANNEVTWGKPGTPLYVPGTSADPERTLKCTITGTDGNQYEMSSPPFKESAGVFAEPACPVMPDGVGVEDVLVQQEGGGTTNTLLDEETTPEYQQWWQQYPECREGACPLDIVKKSDNLSCFSSVEAAGACRDWFADPQKDQNYQCMYGAHNVSLTECYVYADVFKPEKVLGGQGYTDPETGISVPGQSSPGAAKVALGRVITDPTNFAGCLDTGWAAANPVEWVIVPMQCTLQWAFAPRPGVVLAELAGLEQAWAKKPPAVITGAVSQWNVAPTMDGCSKTVNFLGSALPVWNVCPGSAYEWLAITSRVILNISVTVGVVWAVRRMTSGSVNYVDG